MPVSIEARAEQKGPRMTPRAPVTAGPRPRLAVRCGICGLPLPEPRPGKPGSPRLYHRRCSNNRRQRLYRMKQAWRRQWAGHVPYQRVSNAEMKLGKRRRYTKAGPRVVRHVCACGKRYYAGGTATGCWECAAQARRENNRRWRRRNVPGRIPA